MRPGPVQAIRMPMDDGCIDKFQFHYRDWDNGYIDKVLNIQSGQWLVIEGDKFLVMRDPDFCEVFEEIDHA